MIFCSASGSAVDASAAASAGAAASGSAGGADGATGFGGATGSGVVRNREIGGRNDLVLASPSARLALGFFSSINETVSMTGFGGFGASGAFGGGGGWAVIFPNGFRVGADGGGGLAGASTLALFA